MLKICVFLVGLAGLISFASAQQDTVQLPDSIAVAGDTVTWVKKIPGYCESPAWEPSTGSVYFDHQIGNNVANWPVWRIRPGMDTGVVFIDTFQNNGMDFDPQGRLIICQNGRLSRYKSDGTLDSTLITFSTSIQANDLTIGSNGAIYFTSYGNSVYYLSPARQLSTAGTGFNQANGIEWLEDQNSVYVDETGANRMRRFPIPSAGVLGTAVNFVINIPGPDGSTVDVDGNFYIVSNSHGEVRVYNALGDSIGRIAMRTASGIYDSVRSSNRVGIASNASNCVFGGADLKTLYITGDGGLYSIPLKIAGRPRPGEPSSIRDYRISPKGKPDATPLFIRDLQGRLLTGYGNMPMVRIYPEKVNPQNRP